MRAAWVAILFLMIVGCRERAKPQAAATVPSHSTPVPAENIEKSLAAAQQYITSNDLAKAQAILLTLIDRAPGEVRAHELLGQVYGMQAEVAKKKGDDLSAKSLFAKG